MLTRYLHVHVPLKGKKFDLEVEGGNVEKYVGLGETDEVGMEFPARDKQ